MKEKVFLDSGIFIAALDRTDHWHAQAARLFRSTPKHWCTSLLIVSETYSWFLHRMGEEAGRRFQVFIHDLPHLRLFEITLQHHRSAVQMLEKLRGTKLTYVDASSLSFIETHAIPIVWSTDRHLALTGTTIFPV